MAAPSPLFKVRGLTKVYGEGAAAVHAIRGIDLDIAAGEIVVMLGPISALFRDAGEWTVFVAEDGRAHRRKIEIGEMNDEHAEVRGGLAPGEAVIVYPSDRVGEGTRVSARE